MKVYRGSEGKVPLIVLNHPAAAVCMVRELPVLIEKKPGWAQELFWVC
jgi:hypothetical protein